VGGVAVTVTGSGFVSSSDLVCRFDATVVSATYSSPTTLSCIAPQHIAGTVVLEVANNNEDFTSSNTAFTYYGIAQYEYSARIITLNQKTQ